jgi:acylphosphatase
MIRQARIVVKGIVQGVFYRYSTKQTADALGLAGTVRNRPDGSVEVVAEGEEKDVARLIEWCKQGPRGAFVERTDVEWTDLTGGFRDFSIIY